MVVGWREAPIKLRKGKHAERQQIWDMKPVKQARSWVEDM